MAKRPGTRDRAFPQRGKICTVILSRSRVIRDILGVGAYFAAVYTGDSDVNQIRFGDGAGLRTRICGSVVHRQGISLLFILYADIVRDRVSLSEVVQVVNCLRGEYI